MLLIILKDMKKIIILFMLVCTINSAKAQGFYVSGNVTDSISGEPILGMIVYVKGTTIGTVCDLFGDFRLPVRYNDILVFSFIGYKTIEYKITEIDYYCPIIIQMVEDFWDESLTRQNLGFCLIDAKHPLSLSIPNDNFGGCNRNE